MRVPSSAALLVCVTCPLPPRVEQVTKRTRVQAFLPQPPVKTLHMRILYRLAWRDVHQFDALLQAPGQKMPAGELRPVVATESPSVSRAPPQSPPAPASPGGWRSWCPPPAPRLPACTPPARSARGRLARCLRHRARNPRPIPGWARSVQGAAIPHAAAVCAPRGESSVPPPGTRDTPACGSRALRSGPPQSAAAGSPTVASPAPLAAFLVH